MTPSTPKAPHTDKQARLLALLTERGPRYVRGPMVRTARSLERLGLVTLTDNGSLDGHGNTDGERWFVELVTKP